VFDWRLDLVGESSFSLLARRGLFNYWGLECMVAGVELL
jgi:hypothetical protein